MERQRLDGLYNPQDVNTAGAVIGNIGDMDVLNERKHGEVGSEYDLVTNMTKESVMGMKFTTLEDAELFYKKYARVRGFGVRLDDIYRNKEGEAQSRRIVCSCEGKRDARWINKPERQREHKALTRSGCKASFRVRKNKETRLWEVYHFDDDHNHNTLALKHTPMHRSHRRISELDAAQVDTMQAYGMKGSHIYGYIAGQSGGYDKVGFTRKDMYNHINRVRNEKIKDGDVVAAIHYLNGKSEGELGFFVKHSLDANGHLEHLFWCDGCSKLDYKFFGDVLAFDTTYKKNKYNRPLVIFSGLNHHRKTVVFGCALVADETEENYKWVLMALLEAMDGKEPASIITDSDKSMRNAIKCVMPRSCHRLCAWHLERNATSNIANTQFTKAFKECMFADISVLQFEQKWNSMVEKFAVKDNMWVQKMYKKRNMWAATLLRGKMFVGLRTTSLCEGMNSYIKRFVSQSQNLVEFLHHFHRGLNYLRYNEIVADFKTYNGNPVLTTPLESIEASGAYVYTREAFWVLRREIKMAGACVKAGCKQRLTTRTYKVHRFMHPNTYWSVHIDKHDGVRIICDCGKLQSFGIPCQHIIFVMVQEDINKLPPCVIVRRWTKNAKDMDDKNLGLVDDNDKLVNLRFGSLIQDCRLMCNYASRSQDSFLQVKHNVRSILVDLENKYHPVVNIQTSKATMKECRILDPHVVRSKGRPSRSAMIVGRKRKRCAICRIEGHTRVTCPQNRNISTNTFNMEHESSQGLSLTQKSIQQNMPSGNEVHYMSSQDEGAFMEALVDDCLGFSAFQDFAITEGAGAEVNAEDTGIWTLDGRNFQDEENCLEGNTFFPKEGHML